MNPKLAGGDAFPELALELTTGERVVVPRDLGDGFKVILFYRGHW